MTTEPSHLHVEFDRVTKSFGSTRALDQFSLEVSAGELVCLLGPSGCGKTTALRILAGFEWPDAGDVRVDGTSVLGVEARKRGFGMVFQSYSLFPNMTAAGNIAYPLHLKRIKGATQQGRLDDLLTLTGLTEHADKYPHQLSGGQQQRVALARALATEPPVLLLDEPLSALDAAVREQLRDEIRRLQRDTGITTLFVTHDQHEAMAIADRLGVMHAGRLVQIGKPADVYANPAGDFVATFLGTNNEIPVVNGTVLGVPTDATTPYAHVRPEHIRIVQDNSTGVPATVRWISFLGPLTRVALTTQDACDLLADLPSAVAAGLKPGAAVRVVLDR